MPTVAEAAQLFLNHRRGRRVSAATIRQYGSVLTYWREWLERKGYPTNLGSITIEHVRGYILWCVERGLARNTIETRRRVLRSLWYFLEGERLLSEEQLLFWRNNRIPSVKGIEEAFRPYATDETIRALLEGIGEGSEEESARNRAIILLLWDSGMRVAELCSLTDMDMDLAARRAAIVGKGGKRAMVFWGPQAGAAMLRYLSVRRGKRGGSLPFFRGCASRNSGGALTPDSIRHMVKKLGVALPKGASVHFIRHGFAHRSLDRGLDVSQVQQLMRHSSPETTLRYLKERPDKLQALHRKALGLGEASAQQQQRKKLP